MKFTTVEEIMSFIKDKRRNHSRSDMYRYCYVNIGWQHFRADVSSQSIVRITWENRVKGDTAFKIVLSLPGQRL